MATTKTPKKTTSSSKTSKTNLLAGKKGLNPWLILPLLAVVIAGGVLIKFASHASTVPVGGGGKPYLACSTTTTPVNPVAGKPFTITVNIKNTGTATWRRDYAAYQGTFLYYHVTADSKWLEALKTVKNSTALPNIAPGQSIKSTMSFTIPATITGKDVRTGKITTAKTTRLSMRLVPLVNSYSLSYLDVYKCQTADWSM